MQHYVWICDLSPSILCSKNSSSCASSTSWDSSLVLVFWSPSEYYSVLFGGLVWWSYFLVWKSSSSVNSIENRNHLFWLSIAKKCRLPWNLWRSLGPNQKRVPMERQRPARARGAILASPPKWSQHPLELDQVGLLKIPRKESRTQTLMTFNSCPNYLPIHCSNIPSALLFK